MPFTWRYDSKKAGGGALADLGSHIIDISRFLIGEITSVCGIQSTFIKERKIAHSHGESAEVDVDDYACALLRFANGIPGRLETSWASLGRKVYLDFEVNGTEGSVYFNFEKPNESELLLWLGSKGSAGASHDNDGTDPSVRFWVFISRYWFRSRLSGLAEQRNLRGLERSQYVIKA